MPKKDLFFSIYPAIAKVSRGQTALGAPSLDFSPSARTCSLKRSHHYDFGCEHALRVKVLRDHRAGNLQGRNFCPHG